MYHALCLASVKLWIINIYMTDFVDHALLDFYFCNLISAVIKVAYCILNNLLKLCMVAEIFFFRLDTEFIFHSYIFF